MVSQVTGRIETIDIPAHYAAFGNSLHRGRHDTRHRDYLERRDSRRNDRQRQWSRQDDLGRLCQFDARGGAYRHDKHWPGGLFIIYWGRLDRATHDALGGDSLNMMSAATDEPSSSLKGHIKIQDLARSFTDKDGNTVNVIQDCSVEFEPGLLNVVMGQSGCGKSTLAYLLAGYMKPDRGQIEIDGRPVSEPGADRIMVFQETALWPWMSVTDNVVFGPLVRNAMPKIEAKQKAEELLERFGLIDFKDKYPNQLSGGMQRRAEIAQALINSPDIMILDEPFRGLDVMTRELLQEYYLQLFEDTQLSTLFITSELEEALFLADRIYVMGEAPNNIDRVIEIDLPRPRTFDVTTTQRYLELKQIAMDYLYAGSEDPL